MWKLDKDGQPTKVCCDICGEPANVRIMVANEVIAEGCDLHAAEIRKKVRDMLKTKPGPPDKCAYQEPGKASNPRCKLDANHEGDHEYS